MCRSLNRAAPSLALAVWLALLLGGCRDEQHGFLKISGDVLFNDSDRLVCGEARIVPKAGFLDAFVTLPPQDCDLTLHRDGEFMGFGTKICDVAIKNNRITTVYVSQSRTGLACSISG